MDMNNQRETIINGLDQAEEKKSQKKKNQKQYNT